MSNEEQPKNTITVVTSAEPDGLRSFSGILTKKLEIDAEQLSININLFLDQMGQVVAQTPETVGAFRLAEIQVFTEITAKGQVVLWGIGGDIGASGGIKFVFKK